MIPTTEPERKDAPDGGRGMLITPARCRTAPQNSSAIRTVTFEAAEMEIRQAIAIHNLRFNGSRFADRLLRMTLVMKQARVLLPNELCFIGLTGILKQHLNETLKQLEDWKIYDRPENWYGFLIPGRWKAPLHPYFKDRPDRVKEAGQLARRLATPSMKQEDWEKGPSLDDELFALFLAQRQPIAQGQATDSVTGNRFGDCQPGGEATDSVTGNRFGDCQAGSNAVGSDAKASAQSAESTGSSEETGLAASPSGTGAQPSPLGESSTLSIESVELSSQGAAAWRWLNWACPSLSRQLPEVQHQWRDLCNLNPIYVEGPLRCQFLLLSRHPEEQDRLPLLGKKARDDGEFPGHKPPSQLEAAAWFAQARKEIGE